jgi:uncharacterized protein (DUF849 family)
MTLQACLNGARSRKFHAAVPLGADELARDAKLCRAAGASELHVHPRDGTGAESFDARWVGAALQAIRIAVPGMPAGLSTREGILADPALRQRAFASWRVLPDYVSVNLSEPDAPDVVSQMLERGIGIEAGLATAADASRLAGLPDAARILRVLIEIEEQEQEAAEAAASGIVAILDRASIGAPRQLHGFDQSVWWMFDMALQLGCQQRIGLEDGKLLPDGSEARGNAELIAAAVTRAGGAGRGERASNQAAEA